MLSLSHCVTSTLSRCHWKRRRCYALACGIMHRVCRGAGLYKPVHQKHPCTLWAMETQANYSFAYSLYVSMLCEYHHRYGKWHGAGKHSVAIHHGIKYIPQGGLTPHPQCFSGHDDLKTDENWPIVAYRAFYVVDKSRFARYNKGRDMPYLMKKPLVLNIGG